MPLLPSLLPLLLERLVTPAASHLMQDSLCACLTLVDFKYSELHFLEKQGFYASTLETLGCSGETRVSGYSCRQANTLNL